MPERFDVQRGRMYHHCQTTNLHPEVWYEEEPIMAEPLDAVTAIHNAFRRDMDLIDGAALPAGLQVSDAGQLELIQRRIELLARRSQNARR